MGELPYLKLNRELISVESVLGTLKCPIQLGVNRGI